MRDGKIQWCIVNQSLCVLWREYWDLKETSPAGAERLQAAIKRATQELRK